MRAMVKHRVYIVTSVVGGYFDDEFSVDTIKLFERIISQDFTIYLDAYHIAIATVNRIDVLLSVCP